MQIIKKEDEEYPKRLLQIKDAPKELYVEGDSSLLDKDSIAIVGARKYTEYGKKSTERFAKELSQKGVCIVSGLAQGIDSIAHMSAMKEKGKTIAVIGSGFENIYPKENRKLYDEILENGGCIITEHAPETDADLAKFPKRNRIISGISMGVLVIEARFRSGTATTARHAINQHKEVFCIPHSLETPTGYIPNFFIQNGAQLVMSSSDILEYYYSEELENVEIPKEYEEIYNMIGQMPISANEIAKALGKNVQEVIEGLCMLELDGNITNLPGNLYVRNIKYEDEF